MEGGYGAWSEPAADLIRQIYGSEGIPLDMTYTGKAFYGMVKYLEENQIQGKQILFLHTGGTPLFLTFLNKRINKHEKINDPGSELFSAPSL